MHMHTRMPSLLAGILSEFLFTRAMVVSAAAIGPWVPVFVNLRRLAVLHVIFLATTCVSVDRLIILF